MFLRKTTENSFCEMPTTEYKTGDLLDDNFISSDIESILSSKIGDEYILKLVESFYFEHNNLPKNRDELLECGFDEEAITGLFEYMVTDEDKVNAIVQYLSNALKSMPNVVSKSFSRAIRVKAKI